MNRTLKSLSVLLSYPTEEMVAAGAGDPRGHRR